ncbi:MAG: hypothetical protein ACXAB7_11475 [Candidatus Kariarchaeaceae archaeon]|jgi:hypothetical protein
MGSEEEDKGKIVESMVGKFNDSKNIMKLTSEARSDSEPLNEDETTKIMGNTKVVYEAIQKYRSEIPFVAIHEATGIDYDMIKQCVLELILAKKVTGFINDSSTADDLTDDILIFRDERFIDVMDPGYETG